MTRAVITLCVVLLAGCKSSEPGAPTPTAAEDGPRAGISQAFQEASRDFTERLAQYAAKGWPAHVTLSGAPPRPAARVEPIANHTRGMIDPDALRDELVQQLVDQGVVDVVAVDAAAEADAEAARFAGREVPEAPDAGAPAAFIIDGTLSDDVSERDGVVTTTSIVVLRLVDAKKGEIAVHARAETRSVRER